MLLDFITKEIVIGTGKPQRMLAPDGRPYPKRHLARLADAPTLFDKDPA